MSVPIGGNLNVAQELLPGVAQAQREINQKGGIKGRLLHIVIANDDNNPEIAAKVAQKFIDNEQILAVIGHNSSSTSLGAAPVYNKGKIVAVSPTSSSRKLSGISPYLFRSVPSRFSAEIMSDYILNDANINKPFVGIVRMQPVAHSTMRCVGLSWQREVILPIPFVTSQMPSLIPVKFLRKSSLMGQKGC